MSAIPEIVKAFWPFLLLFLLLGAVLGSWKKIDDEGTMASNWGPAGWFVILILFLTVAVPVFVAIINSPEAWGLSPGGETYNMYGR